MARKPNGWNPSMPAPKASTDSGGGDYREVVAEPSSCRRPVVGRPRRGRGGGSAAAPRRRVRRRSGARRPNRLDGGAPYRVGRGLTAGGRSHSQAWVGCMVWSTTPSSSPCRAPRSTWSRRRPANASRVRAASWRRRLKRRSTRSYEHVGGERPGHEQRHDQAAGQAPEGGTEHQPGEPGPASRVHGHRPVLGSRRAGRSDASGTTVRDRYGPGPGPDFRVGDLGCDPGPASGEPAGMARTGGADVDP
jgi:hypothetical protein